MLEKNEGSGRPASSGCIGRTLKFLFGALVLLLVICLGVYAIGANEEREHFRVERDYLFVLRMLESDEGEEFRLPSGTGLRTYINDGGTIAYLSLGDGVSVQMNDFGKGRFACYNDGYFYVAKPVNGDYVFRRQDATKLPIEKFRAAITNSVPSDASVPVGQQ